MARTHPGPSHENTPATVLAAPVLTTVFKINPRTGEPYGYFTGSNRAQRRANRGGNGRLFRAKSPKAFRPSKDEQS